MPANQNKKRQIFGRNRISAESRDPADNPGAGSSAEKSKKEHKVNLENAGALIRHALDTVRNTGVDKALFEIVRTVRLWPALIEKAGSKAFVPPFAATDIHAEELTEDKDTITKVSFDYSGASYDLVTRIKGGSANEFTFGTITLCENGTPVIGLETIQDLSQGLFSFRELNAFKYGAWIENIIRIEAEITA